MLVKLPTFLFGLLLKVFVQVHVAVRLVKISHTHGALFLDYQPLVNTVIVEIMIARPEHLDHLRVVNRVIADRTVVHLYLGGVGRHVSRGLRQRGSLAVIYTVKHYWIYHW